MQDRANAARKTCIITAETIQNKIRRKLLTQSELPVDWENESAA